MTKALKFREVNMLLMPPKGTEEQMYALPVMSNGMSCTSCWEFSDEEMKYIMEHKKVWVQVMGQTHPPMVVIAESPLREDITDFTQIRIRPGQPTLEAIIKAGIKEATVMFVDGERVWERPHNVIDPNSDDYRKLVAEKLLEVIATGVLDAPEGFAKMNAHKLYKIMFEERSIVPNTLQFSMYIKREKFVTDMRSGELPADMSEYLWLE